MMDENFVLEWCHILDCVLFEPQHDKTNKITCAPVWSESLLFSWTLWSLATHWTHWKDWSGYEDAQADQSILWAYRPFCYAPPPESGGVLCYTLRNFECPSVRPSVRLSVRPSVVRPSIRPSVSAHHHSCIGNSSYSFRPILLKLYRCFKDGLKICILFFQNPEIIFYHFFPIFNLDIFQALILQICIWNVPVSATPPTVFGESFWNFTGVLRMVWRYAYCFFRILKLFFITFFAFLTDIFRALILQICIWSMYLVSATPPTVFGESFWNFTGVLRMVCAYCFFRILKLFFITFYAFLT